MVVRSETGADVRESITSTQVRKCGFPDLLAGLSMMFAFCPGRTVIVLCAHGDSNSHSMNGNKLDGRILSHSSMAPTAVSICGASSLNGCCVTLKES